MKLKHAMPNRPLPKKVTAIERHEDSFNHLLAHALNLFSIPYIDLLKSPPRERRFTVARAYIAFHAVRAGYASMLDLARFFNRDDSSLRESMNYHQHKWSE